MNANMWERGSLGDDMNAIYEFLTQFHQRMPNKIKKKREKKEKKGKGKEANVCILIAFNDIPRN